MHSILRITAIAAIATAIMTAPGEATIVFVDSGDFAGSRSTLGGGLVGTQEWSGTPPASPDDNGFKIAWNITQSGDVYTYEYILSGASAVVGEMWGEYAPLQKGLSHVILEVTPGWETEFAGLTYALDELVWDETDEVYVWQNTPLSDIQTDDPTEYSNSSSNPNMPAGSLYGVKIDAEGEDLEFFVNRLTFSTERSPVWGNFYAKDGRLAGSENLPENFASVWNRDFLVDPGTVAEYSGFVARPDGVPPPPGGGGGEIPEPGSVLIWMVLAGCGACYSWSWRRSA